MAKTCLAVSLLLLSAVSSVQAQTMSASMCKVLTNKAERQKCLMRYGAENIKKENSDKARDQQSLKTRKDQFNAQSKALKPFDEPKILERFDQSVRFIIEGINRGQYINCQTYDLEGKSVAKKRYRISPKAEVLTMEIPLGKYAKKVRCK